jgi:hypothetical protein
MQPSFEWESISKSNGCSFTLPLLLPFPYCTTNCFKALQVVVSNLGLKSIVSHGMTLALVGAKAYGGQFGWTNNLELPHTKVDHGIWGLL